MKFNWALKEGEEDLHNWNEVPSEAQEEKKSLFDLLEKIYF